MKRDITRQTALGLQRGINQSSEWTWGPIALRYLRSPDGVGYSLSVSFGKYGCQFAVQKLN